MINILIVDDEPLVRIGIKSAVDWESNGFTIIGEAANGEQALQVVEKSAPDIIITDIKMPVIDGISLIKEIHRRFPHIKVIALSSYGDFDYVREAMKYGAVDYLLKNNLTPDKILPLLEGFKNEITRRKLVSIDSQKYDRYVDECISMLKDNFLKDIISGIIPDKNKILEGLSSFNLEHLDGNLLVFVLLVDNFKAVQQKYYEKDETLLRFSIKNILEEILGGSSNCEVFISSSKEYIVLWPFKGKGREDSMDSTVMETCGNVVEVVRDYLNIGVSIGISNFHTGVLQIRDAYREALQAADFRFFKGKGSIVNYSEIGSVEFVKGGSELSPELTHKLEIFIKTADQNLAGDILSRMHARLHRDGKLLNESLSRDLYMMLAEKFNSLFFREYPQKMLKYDVYERILAMDDIFDIERVLKEHFSACFDTAEGCSDRDTSRIHKVIEYIHRNYDRELTLQMVAEKVNLNSFYLSRLFKKETGESFTDYLIRIRIEKSKELLHQGIKAFEAAEKVGYYNYTYFSKLFKKVVGVNPSEYTADSKKLAGH